MPKLWGMDFVKLLKITVIQTFFLNAFRYWADFWYVSYSWWVLDQVEGLFHSTNFCRNYGLWTMLNFWKSQLYRLFFYTPSDIELIFDMWDHHHVCVQMCYWNCRFFNFLKPAIRVALTHLVSFFFSTWKSELKRCI